MITTTYTARLNNEIVGTRNSHREYGAAVIVTSEGKLGVLSWARNEKLALASITARVRENYPDVQVTTDIIKSKKGEPVKATTVKPEPAKKTAAAKPAAKQAPTPKDKARAARATKAEAKPAVATKAETAAKEAEGKAAARAARASERSAAKAAKVQVKAEAKAAKAAARAAKPSAEKTTRATDPRLPAAGTVLSREWHGKTIEVTVLEGGKVEMKGKEYRSLTGAARALYGKNEDGELKHVNGFRFFNLGQYAKAEAKPETAAE